MRRKTIRVVNALGFHARAAAKFVAEASRFEAQVTVVFKDKEMDGKSILGLLLLAAPCGASIQVRADGRDEKEAVKAALSVPEDRRIVGVIALGQERTRVDGSAATRRRRPLADVLHLGRFGAPAATG